MKQIRESLYRVIDLDEAMSRSENWDEASDKVHYAVTKVLKDLVEKFPNDDRIALAEVVRSYANNAVDTFLGL